MKPEFYIHITDRQAALLEDRDFKIMIAITKPLRQTYLREAHAKRLDPVRHLQQIRDLTQGQVPGLITERQLQILEEGQIGWMTSDQIENLVRSKEMVDRLHDDQITHIHPNTLEHLEDDKIRFLGKISQVRALKPQRYDRIEAPQAQLLQDSDFEIMIAIRKELRQVYLRKAHVEQLHATQHRTQLRDLTEQQVPFLKREGQLNTLEESQIGWMTSHQIENLVRSKEMVDRLQDGQIGHIHPDAVEHLIGDKVKFLGKISQVRALKPEHYVRIEEPQAQLLQVSDFEIMIAIKKELRQVYLRQAHAVQLSPEEHTGQIRDLAGTQVPWLVGEAQLKKLDDGQIGWITPPQIGELIRSKEMVDRVHDVQIQYLDPAAVPYIHTEDVGYLTSINQVRALLPMHYPGLTERQVKFLDIEHDLEMIKQLSNDQLSYLPRKQIRSIEDGAFRRHVFLRSCLTPTCQKVSRTLGIIFLTLLGTAALLVGGLAIMGAYASFAPQFTVTLYHALKMVEVAYALTAVGGTLLLGLASYAVYRVCQNRKKVTPLPFIRPKGV